MSVPAYHEYKFTKSAFATSVDCPMKAFYSHPKNRKLYACHTTFPEGLADVGNQFGELARIYEGVPKENVIDSSCRPDENSVSIAQCRAMVQTHHLMQQENADIAEAAFGDDKLLVLADIIHKHGNDIDLIEVKSVGIGSNDAPYKINEKTGNLSSDYEAKILDVTYQKYVIEKCLREIWEMPNLKVHAKLMLINMDVVCDVENLSTLLPIKVKNGKRYVEAAPDIFEKLKGKQRIDRIVDVDSVADSIIADKIPNIAEYFGGCFTKFVDGVSDMYVNMNPNFDRALFNFRCFICEYHKESGDEKLKDGRAECFEKMAGVNFPAEGMALSELKGKSRVLKKAGLDNWLAAGKFQITDADEYQFLPRENALPELIEQKDELSSDDLNYLHIHAAKTGVAKETFLKDAAVKEMAKWTYPLHFIDFETYQGAVPLFTGSHPNEMVLYQFSHHIGHEDGHYEHAGEFICLEPGKFPNFDCVRELKRQLEKDNGTIFRYAEHENTYLNAVRLQLLDSNEKDKDELVAFIESITHPTGNNPKPFAAGARDMVDLKKVTEALYYHPMMGGSNSIKLVLPAILHSDPYFREKYGENLDPYHALPNFKKLECELSKDFKKDFDDSDIYDPEKQIRAGGISKLDYIWLVAGRFNELHAETIRRAALTYCKLDTEAMVRIWEFFMVRCGNI